MSMTITINLLAFIIAVLIHDILSNSHSSPTERFRSQFCSYRGQEIPIRSAICISSNSIYIQRKHALTLK